MLAQWYMPMTEDRPYPGLQAVLGPCLLVSFPMPHGLFTSGLQTAAEASNKESGWQLARAQLERLALIACTVEVFFRPLGWHLALV